MRFGFLLLVCLIPFIRKFLLPIWLLLDLVNSVFYDSKSLSYFEIFHILFIIQFVCKLKQLVDFVFFVLIWLFLSHCPRRFSLFLFLHWFFRNCLRCSISKLAYFFILLLFSLFYTIFLLLKRFYFFSLFFSEFFELLCFLLSKLFLQHYFLSFLVFFAF